MKVDQMAGLGIVYLICCDGGLGQWEGGIKDGE
jgi:hypothetical protein